MILTARLVNIVKLSHPTVSKMRLVHFTLGLLKSKLLLRIKNRLVKKLWHYTILHLLENLYLKEDKLVKVRHTV